MRVMLPDDAKVLGMAEYLTGRPEFLGRLTAWGVQLDPDNHDSGNVTVALVLKGLLKVWGMANERGRLDGDDFILEHASLRTMDSIAKLPGFGLAMHKVEWAREEKEGDVSCVRFPNFVDFNTDKESRLKEQNRERQRRHREKKRAHRAGGNGHGGVTLQSNDRIEEKQSRAEETRAATATAGLDRGMQGGKGGDHDSGAKKSSARPPKPDRQFAGQPAPAGFQSRLDAILGILQIHDFDPFESRPDFLDQVGFLAKLAYADAVGFAWVCGGQPSTLWDYLGRAKRKKSPAAWLTGVMREEFGPELWSTFDKGLPSPAHCQWLLHALANGEVTEA